MKKLIPLLSITVASLLAIPIVSRAEDPKPAGPGGPGGRMNPEERLKMMTEKLGLTQDQQDKIKGIFEKYAPQLKDIMSKGRENLTDDDKGKVRELFKSQGEEIAAVLTPEQKEKLKEERAQHAHGPGAPGAKPGDAPNK